MSIKAILASMTVSALLAPCVNGEPVPAFQSEKLLDTATHVAVAVLTSEEVLQDTGTAGSVDLTVKRRIRGADLPEHLRLKLSRTYRPYDGGAPLPVGATVLACLVRTTDSDEWELADPYYGLYRVSKVRAGIGLADNVRDAVLAELRESLKSDDARVVKAALDALAAFRDRACLEQATALSRSRDVKVAAHALKLRFTIGDGTGLQEAVRLIEQEPKLSEGEKAALAWSMARPGMNIPIQDLNRVLLESPHPTLRTVVATILSQRGDRTSLDALSAGLSDTSRETQYRCIVGLCRITGLSGPGYGSFMQDPEPTVTQWKDWRKTQESIGQPD